MTEVQPLYVSIEGLGDSSSQSEDEDDSQQPDQKKAKRYSRRSESGNYYDDPDFDLDSAGEGDGSGGMDGDSSNRRNNKDKSDDKIVALSKKQLNRLAAMEIYPIPSGGIGTVNASLFNPVTIKWLMKNFETVEGSSLPRYLVYNHYLLHCKSLNIKPINAASFGKVIRSVFLGLQTRRLGTRGNSKYHYCGMRIKPDSPLLHVLISDAEPRKHKSSSSAAARGGAAASNKESTPVPVKPKKSLWTAKNFDLWRQKYCQGLPPNYVQFRFEQNENASTKRHLKPDLDVFIPVTDGLTKEDIIMFKRQYQEHCNNLLSAVISFRLEQVGWTWQLFYKADKRTAAALHNDNEVTNDLPRFTRAKLKKFVTNRNVQKFVNELDKQTYTSIAFLLCPHVTVVVPSEINQIIRNFLAIVEGWLSDALENYPEDFRVMKVKTLQNVMRPLEQTINTNSLYCAIQQSFHDDEKMNGFLKYFEEVDFSRLDSRIGWIAEGTACSEGKKMKDLLKNPNRLHMLVRWIETIVENSLAVKVPMTEFKMNLQNTFLGLSCFTSFIKSELLLLCRESMQVFSCTESFILEYLKYFMHLRTGMQNLIASALASVSCNDEGNAGATAESSEKLGEKSNEKPVVMKEDPFCSAEELKEMTTIKVETKLTEHKVTERLLEVKENNYCDKELDDLLKFLTVKKNGSSKVVREQMSSEQIPASDQSPMDMLDIDETFRKYFSSSGYVTNYFCQKAKAANTASKKQSEESEEEDDNDDDEEEEEEEEEESEEDDDEDDDDGVASEVSDNFEFGPNE